MTRRLSYITALLEDMRRGIDAQAELSALRTEASFIACDLAELPEADLEFVMQFACGCAGLSAEQTVSLLIRYGLTQAAELIRNKPFLFTLQAQAHARRSVA